MIFDMGRLYNTSTGRVLMSIIWGLGLATLFKKACQGRKCHIIQYKNPQFEEVNNLYYKYGGADCYQYIPYESPCPQNGI